ncbi:uncharacterized protein TNCV_3800891 [Trichonephila clavipes]|nr:uncharacterized protein TNCV_3800891 [Trichonephila clavipes]
MPSAYRYFIPLSDYLHMVVLIIDKEVKVVVPKFTFPEEQFHLEACRFLSIKDCDESLRHLSTNTLKRLWGLQIRVYFQSALKEENGIHKADKRRRAKLADEKAIEPATVVTSRGLPNSLSQIIPDMLDWRQIWGSTRQKKGKGKIEPITTGSSYTNTIVIAAEIESGLGSLKTTWYHSAAVQIARACHHSKRRRRWVGVKCSTRNGHRDPKCPSTRLFRMVREDTEVPNEGSPCVRMMAYKAVGCTRAFITMRWSSRRLVCGGRPYLVFVQMTSLGSTGLNTSSQHNQSGIIDELLA